MKQIPLTQGRFALVDDEDYEELNKYKWHAAWAPSTKSFYAARNSKQINNSKRNTIYMHKELLSPAKGMQVDHINHDTLDNRRGNLRIATLSENRANSRIQANSTSGYKGVTWNLRNNKWWSQIVVNCKHEYLGSFTCLMKAAAAYNRAAAKYHGEFACINNIPYKFQN